MCFRRVREAGAVEADFCEFGGIVGGCGGVPFDGVGVVGFAWFDAGGEGLVASFGGFRAVPGQEVRTFLGTWSKVTEGTHEGR